MRNDDLNIISQIITANKKAVERKETQFIGSNQIIILPYENDTVYDWSGTLNIPSEQTTDVGMRFIEVRITSRTADFVLVDLILEMRKTQAGPVYTRKDYYDDITSNTSIRKDIYKLPLEENNLKLQRYRVVLSGPLNQQVYLKAQVMSSDDVDIEVV